MRSTMAVETAVERDGRHRLATTVVATAVIATAVVSMAVVSTAVVPTAVVSKAVISTAVISTAVLTTAVATLYDYNGRLLARTIVRLSIDTTRQKILSVAATIVYISQSKRSRHNLRDLFLNKASPH